MPHISYSWLEIEIQTISSINFFIIKLCVEVSGRNPRNTSKLIRNCDWITKSYATQTEFQVFFFIHVSQWVIYRFWREFLVHCLYWFFFVKVEIAFERGHLAWPENICCWSPILLVKMKKLRMKRVKMLRKYYVQILRAVGGEVKLRMKHSSPVGGAINIFQEVELLSVSSYGSNWRWLVDKFQYQSHKAREIVTT